MVISRDELEFKDILKERATAMNCDLMCFNFTVVISIVRNTQKMRKRFANLL